MTNTQRIEQLEAKMKCSELGHNWRYDGNDFVKRTEFSMCGAHAINVIPSFKCNRCGLVKFPSTSAYAKYQKAIIAIRKEFSDERN